MEWNIDETSRGFFSIASEMLWCDKFYSEIAPLLGQKGVYDAECNITNIIPRPSFHPGGMLDFCDVVTESSAKQSDL